MNKYPVKKHPDKQPSRAQLEAKLKRARAEIKRLKRKSKTCRCVPMTDQERGEMILELCRLIDNLPEDAFDPDNPRRREFSWPMDPILPKQLRRETRW